MLGAGLHWVPINQYTNLPIHQAQRLVDALARGNRPEIAEALLFFIYVVDNYHHIDIGILDDLAVSIRFLARDDTDEHPIPFDDQPFYRSLAIPGLITDESVSPSACHALQLPDYMGRRQLQAEADTLVSAIHSDDGATAAQILRRIYTQMYHCGVLRDHAAQLYSALDCPYPIEELMLRLITLPCMRSGPCLATTPCLNAKICWSDPPARVFAHQEPPPISLPHRNHYTAMLNLAMEKRDPIDISTALRALNYHLFIEHITDPVTWEELDRAIKTIIARTPPDPK